MRREKTELVHLAQGEDKWRAVVNRVTNLRFQSSAGKFLSNEEIFLKNSAIWSLLIMRTRDLAKNRTSFFSNRSNNISRKWGIKMKSILWNSRPLNWYI